MMVSHPQLYSYLEFDTLNSMAYDSTELRIE